jgi:excisionase family DNA binding protein
METTIKKLLTVNEVAEILDLKPARIYELCREKTLPFVLIGQRQYRFSEKALLNWIENGGNQDETENIEN